MAEDGQDIYQLLLGGMDPQDRKHTAGLIRDNNTRARYELQHSDDPAPERRGEPADQG